MRNISISLVLLITGVCGAQTQVDLAHQTKGIIPSAQLPAATTSAVGAVKPDGSTVFVTSGVISVPTATTGSLGLVRPDGSSITIVGGIISAPTSGGGSVTHTPGPLTLHKAVIGNAAADVAVDPSAGSDGSGNWTAVSYASTGTGGYGFIGTDGTQPTCNTGQSGWWADSTANTIRPCNNGVAQSFMFTGTAVLAAQMPALTGDVTTTAGAVATTVAAKYKTLTCQPGIDGATSTTAIGAGTYTQVSCYNATGATWTLTSVKCFTDNNGTSTLAVTNGAGTALLTGAVTCTNSFATGTQSGTTTIASGDYIKFTFVADASTKNATFAVTGTY